MKKTLILFALVLCAICGNAQGQKGLRELSGSFRYNSSAQDSWLQQYASNVEEKNQFFAIQPRIGWFINESSVLGVGLGYEFEKQTHDNDYVAKENTFLISPYFRNYKKISEKFYYTTTVSLSLGFGNIKGYSDEEYKSQGVELLIAPGMSYFISEKWAVKANFGGLYYRNSKINATDDGDDREQKSNGFGIDVSMDSFSLGASYYF